MGELLDKGYDESAALSLREIDARLVEVRMLDGLVPVQIVREWKRTDGATPIQQVTSMPGRLDFAADTTKLETVGDCGEQGVLRYCANPRVEGKQFSGLWCGGPVTFADTKEGGKVCRQTLTRVRAAGHGWYYDTATQRVVITAVEESSSGSGTGDTLSDTVLDALKKCRPAVIRDGKAVAEYRTDKGKRVVTELRFRDFTHESIPFFDAISAADAKTVAQYHLGNTTDMVVVSVRTEIDPETNTVVLSLAMQELVVSYVTSVADLAAIPYDIKPATRETLRAFGISSESKGEGYKFGKVLSWADISRDSADFLYAPGDLDFLSVVVDGEKYLEWGNTDSDPTDDIVYSTSLFTHGGRVWKCAYGATTDFATFDEAYRIGQAQPWWRIMELRVDEQANGLLGFTVVISRPEWHGNDSDGASGSSSGDDEIGVRESISSAEGWGFSVNETLPSLPRAVAESALIHTPTRSGYVVASRQASEGENGMSDINTVWRRVWDYTELNKPTGLPSLDEIEAASVSHRVAELSGGGYEAHFVRVDSAKCPEVVELAKSIVQKHGFRVSSVSVESQEDGSLTVSASSIGRLTYELTEWLSTGDWYSDRYRRQVLNLRDDGAGGYLDSDGNAYLVPTAGLDTDSDSDDDDTTHAIVTLEKSVDEDGNIDLLIGRNLPKSRLFEYSYQVRRRQRVGTITVKKYRNFMNRAAIQDLIQTPGLGFSQSVSFSVNEFELVDGVVETSPTWYSSVSETVSEEWVETRSWVEQVARKPTQSGLVDDPDDGYYWREVWEDSSWKITTDNSSAASWAKAGFRGGFSGRIRDGLYRAKKVTAISVGEWHDDAMPTEGA